MECVNCCVDMPDDELLCSQCLRKMQACKKHAIYGLIWLIAGLTLTIGTFILTVSNDSGGVYLITYGAIIWGAIEFGRGLFGYLHFKLLQKNSHKIVRKENMNDGRVNEDALQRYLAGKKKNDDHPS